MPRKTAEKPEKKGRIRVTAQLEEKDRDDANFVLEYLREQSVTKSENMSDVVRLGIRTLAAEFRKKGRK